MYEKHESYLFSDISESSTRAKQKELFRRLFGSSNRHGGRLLRDSSFLKDHADALIILSSEYARQMVHEQTMSATERRAEIQTEYQSPNSSQKAVFDEILRPLEDRTISNSARTDGKAFFLQGRAGRGKTYMLHLLRQMAEHKGLIVQITATTGIAASLYEDGRTLHSLLGIRVDDKDKSNDGSSVRSLKCGPRSQRAELLPKTALIIIDETAMMDRKIFDLIDAILKDLRCDRSSNNRPRFGGVTVVLAGDYLQLLSVVSARQWEEDEHGNVQYVILSLLNQLP